MKIAFKHIISKINWKFLLRYANLKWYSIYLFFLSHSTHVVLEELELWRLPGRGLENQGGLKDEDLLERLSSDQTIRNGSTDVR